MPDRVLVAYATRTGSTAQVAEAVGETLRARGFDLTVGSIENDPSPEGCAAVIVASAVNGLKPQRVSVVDEAGRLLADGSSDDTAAGGSSADERKLTFERRMREQVESIVTSVVGLQRVFHLEQMTDRGFALLTGGRSCPTRQQVGGWRRHLRWYEVDAFCRRTAPWDWIAGDDALVSFDEHTLPRWTHKFSVSKGYVTTRNKYMRCEKLFYGYHVDSDSYLCVQATPGRTELRDLAVPLTRRVLRGGRWGRGRRKRG